MASQPAQLVAVSEGQNILLDKHIVLIGRHQECDIQIPSRKISRRHCCIAQVNDHFVVRDLCSTNGVRINGVRVNEGTVKPGDELTIGNFRYQLSWPEREGENNSPNASAKDDAAGAEEDPSDSCDEPQPLAEPGQVASVPSSKFPEFNVSLNDSQFNTPH